MSWISKLECFHFQYFLIKSSDCQFYSIYGSEIIIFAFLEWLLIDWTKKFYIFLLGRAQLVKSYKRIMLIIVSTKRLFRVLLNFPIIKVQKRFWDCIQLPYDANKLCMWMTSKKSLFAISTQYGSSQKTRIHFVFINNKLFRLLF